MVRSSSAASCGGGSTSVSTPLGIHTLNPTLFLTGFLTIKDTAFSVVQDVLFRVLLDFVNSYAATSGASVTSGLLVFSRLATLSALTQAPGPGPVLSLSLIHI